MNLPKKLLTAIVAPLGAAALLGGLVGCGGDDGTASEDTATDSAVDSREDVASRLHEAQLSGFQGLERVEEESHAGRYGELDAVREAAENRDSVTLDKPECADPTRQWGELPEVREAPASLALFRGENGAITHILLRLPEDLAAQAVDTVPSEECATYEATMEDGSSHSYTVRELDIETIGDQSRGIVVETESEEGEALLYSLLYRDGQHLGAVSMLGGPDAEQRIVDFATAALDYQNEVLG
ncbi:hypothetical protein NI17_018790 [Thermobifida halotolerans]|uniref:Uncharacterized protein n=1 Tax=Thermobifida halotolerans TaxID=483545 RepID=A0A399FX02_9ACTN|nr:hypothetical protein [Thermobifida halotolerans]UOE18806.1 hypothetical protein NI17_018790 [Thermobifida halotolerans]